MPPEQKRRSKLNQNLNHDPCYNNLKFTEPTVCPECCAVYQHGNWKWLKVPVEFHETLCPACRRINDRAPAAFLVLSGEFFTKHREEIINLIDNYEQRESHEHPLKRIINRSSINHSMLITFTDQHMARSIGEALQKAYQGCLEYQYSKGEIMLHVTWTC